MFSWRNSRWQTRRSSLNHRTKLIRMHLSASVLGIAETEGSTGSGFWCETPADAVSGGRTRGRRYLRPRPRSSQPRSRQRTVGTAIGKECQCPCQCPVASVVREIKCNGSSVGCRHLVPNSVQGDDKARLFRLWFNFFSDLDDEVVHGAI